MFRRKGNIPTPSESYLPVGTFRNELFYVTGPRSVISSRNFSTVVLTEKLLVVITNHGLSVPLPVSGNRPGCHFFQQFFLKPIRDFFNLVGVTEVHKAVSRPKFLQSHSL